MSLATMEAMHSFFFNHQKEVEFVWHGGEPLFAGLHFYKSVSKEQQHWTARGCSARNAIQTNGTQLTPAWVEFFEGEGYSVGLSLDGPPEFHDQHRLDFRGNGSSSAVLAGLDLLVGSTVFSGVICCVTRANKNHPERVLEYLTSRGVKSVKFNRLRPAVGYRHDGFDGVSFEEYVDFLLRAFRWWVQRDQEDLHIHDIEVLAGLLLGGTQRDCTVCAICPSYVTVAADGSVSGCDSLPNCLAGCYGNVNRDDARSILAAPSLRQFVAENQQARANCGMCPLFSLCRGGCFVDWRLDQETGAWQHSYCSQFKRLMGGLAAALRDYGLVKMANGSVANKSVERNRHPAASRAASRA